MEEKEFYVYKGRESQAEGNINDASVPEKQSGISSPPKNNEGVSGQKNAAARSEPEPLRDSVPLFRDTTPCEHTHETAAAPRNRAKAWTAAACVIAAMVLVGVFISTRQKDAVVYTGGESLAATEYTTADSEQEKPKAAGTTKLQNEETKQAVLSIPMPGPPASYGNSPSNINNLGSFCVWDNGDNAVITDPKQYDLLYGDYKGNGIEPLGVYGCYINHWDGCIYYYDYSKHAVCRLDKMDNMKQLYAGNVDSLIAADGWLYFIGTEEGKDYGPIYRMKMDGTERQRLGTEKCEIYGLAVDGAWVYFVNPMDEFVYRMTLDGSFAEAIFTEPSSEVIPANDWVYISTDSGLLYRVSQDSGQPVIQKVSDRLMSVVNIYEGWIYYASVEQNNNLYKMTVDGTGDQKLFEQYVYAINVSSDIIQCMVMEEDDFKGYLIPLDGGYYTTLEDVLAQDEQQTETTAEAETEAEYNNDFVFPDSDSRYLSQSEGEALDDASLRIAINEIYARRGRKFNSADLSAYFSSKSWYDGTIEPEDFSTAVFNQYERANMELLAEIQNQRRQ